MDEGRRTAFCFLTSCAHDDGQDEQGREVRRFHEVHGAALCYTKMSKRGVGIQAHLGKHARARFKVLQAFLCFVFGCFCVKEKILIMRIGLDIMTSTGVKDLATLYS